MTRGRAVALAVLVGGVVFGASMGEYSTIDWWKMKREVRQRRDRLELLRREVDSLAAYADSIEHDEATQERVARQSFGMVRDGEILYRLEPVGR